MPGVAALKAAGRFMVVGHRGEGMNALTLSDQRLTAVKENSLLPFNQVGPFPIDVIEFDIRVLTLLSLPLSFRLLGSSRSRWLFSLRYSPSKFENCIWVRENYQILTDSSGDKNYN